MNKSNWFSTILLCFTISLCYWSYDLLRDIRETQYFILDNEVKKLTMVNELKANFEVVGFKVVRDTVYVEKLEMNQDE